MSAHKFHGPKGVGALYVRKGMPLSSLIEGGAQERKRRAGTENLPGIIASAVAINNATEDLDRNRAIVLPLRDRLIAGLGAIPHSILNGEKEERLFSNVHFCFEGIEGESLLLMLSDQGISASSGSACTSGSLDPSHVLLAIGRPHEIAHGSLRLTLDETATVEQVDYVVDKVKETVEFLRNMSPVWRDLNDGKREFIIKE
jgi:cysteine desulfurase